MNKFEEFKTKLNYTNKLYSNVILNVNNKNEKIHGDLGEVTYGKQNYFNIKSNNVFTASVLKMHEFR